MSSSTLRPYRRVAIFMGQGAHTVGGYCPGGYIPEGTFPTIHATLGRPPLRRTP